MYRRGSAAAPSGGGWIPRLFLPQQGIKLHRPSEPTPQRIPRGGWFWQRSSIFEVRRMRKLILCVLFFVGLCFGQIQQAPPAVINFDDHTGFVQIFDGATLTNWDGAKDVW